MFKCLQGMKIQSILSEDGACIELQRLITVNLVGKVNADPKKLRLIFGNFAFWSMPCQFWRRGERLFLWSIAVHHCEQSKFSCWSRGWMTQVSDFFFRHLLTPICLWCWQSLQMHCGNGQGLTLVSEFYCGILDICSMLGEGLLWEVEIWIVYLAWHLLLIELCLQSRISSPGSRGFSAFAFLTLQNLMNVSWWFCLGSVWSYGLCLHLQVQCSHCITTSVKFLLWMWFLHFACF